MDPETIARLQAQHERELQRWFRAVPSAKTDYTRCQTFMQPYPGACHWDGQRFTDASWDAHHVRHIFGIRDPLHWLGLMAEMQAGGLATLCGVGYEPDEPDKTPLDAFVELDIRMRGILWLAERVTPQPTQATSWYCDECVCYWTGCFRQTTRPLALACWEHAPAWERTDD
jgi:hypothetical protein